MAVEGGGDVEETVRDLGVDGRGGGARARGLKWYSPSGSKTGCQPPLCRMAHISCKKSGDCGKVKINGLQNIGASNGRRNNKVLENSHML